MLRLIYIGNQLPISFPADPTATFQPGQIGQLKVMGNEVVCGLSDGTAPLGIIDDVNASAFTANSIDEVVDISVVGVNDGYGTYVSAVETEKRMRFANIVRSSFTSNVSGIILYETNGVIAAPIGTPLNYDSDGDGVVDTVRVVVSYVYRIPNIPGDSSIIGSGRITLWIGRGIFETDQYDVTQRYVVNATLFVNSDGKLTSRQPITGAPGIAMVTGPPSGLLSSLEFLYL
jgi:hypothetical protein